SVPTILCVHGCELRGVGLADVEFLLTEEWLDALKEFCRDEHVHLICARINDRDRSVLILAERVCLFCGELRHASNYTTPGKSETNPKGHFDAVKSGTQVAR